MRRASNERKMAARRSSPRGRVSDGSTAKSGGLEGARVDGQSRGEGRVLVRSIEEENGGDKKGGVAAPGRPFCTSAWSWGMAQQGGVTRQARAEREREGEGGVPPRPAGGALSGNGLKPTGAGGTARPCRVSGLNRGGGGRLSGGVGRHSAGRRGSNGIQTISK
jgi:hypothetical protein